MNTAKLMENERHRWSYMNDTAMTRRLGNITNLDKLDCFILLARENNNRNLEQRAIMKRQGIDEWTGTEQQTPSIFGNVNCNINFEL